MICKAHEAASTDSEAQESSSMIREAQEAGLRQQTARRKSPRQ